MMINEKLLQERIVTHKKTIAGLFHNHSDIESLTEIGVLIGRLKKQYSEISLVVANFKCQRCGSNMKLQYHHLIPRIIKFYVDKIRYISCRFYWSNVIILCNGCHCLYHGDVSNPKKPCIEKKTIEKLKKKYVLKE